jgi:sulfatase modifying factor 1
VPDVHPAPWPVPKGREDYPVNHVDWCDAYVFCQNNGKRLCGKIGGGPLTNMDRSDPIDSRISELQNAITHSGRQPFPYEGSYDADACGPDVPTEDSESDGDEDLIPSLRPVATLASCQGGFADLFDLVGNVAELQTACTTSIHDSGAYWRVSGATNQARCTRSALTPGRPRPS